MAIDAQTLQSYPKIGETVQRIRKEMGLTLKDVSKRTGLSVSAVSKIENDLASPTYETLLRFAVGLDLDLTSLFSGAMKPDPLTGRMDITRKGNGIVQRTPHYEYELLSGGLATKEFVPLLTRIRAHSLNEFKGLEGHPGEEFFYVLSGEVILYTQHYRPTHLLPGDSGYFDSTMGHALVSAGEEDATILWIATSVHGVLKDPSGRQDLRE